LLSPDINLSPNPVLNGDNSLKHPGLDNHGMGTVLEELVRRFNEENNEADNIIRASSTSCSAR
jgi:type I restriction enzyme M protein